MTSRDQEVQRRPTLHRGQFPLGAAISLADLDHDPHPWLARLRDTEPVSWLPALNGWIVTRHDFAVAVMRAGDHARARAGRAVLPRSVAG